mmetsp:Transcript_18125/g.35229  ORF Transcript_18125/g.35229 Transcript_18125/m.35229 type:complete len:270 (-) Transcript_18125:128-937(-)
MTNPPTAPITISPETLRERVVIGSGGTAVNRGSLTKVAQRYRAYIEAICSCSRSSQSCNEENNDQSTTSRQNALRLSESLARELLLHELEIRKLLLSSRASDGNTERYDSTLSRLEETLSNTQREIETLTVDLSNERQIKKFRQEYDGLAKISNDKYPPIRKTTTELEKVENDIQKVAEEVRTAQWELKVREKQFRVLMASIGDLKCVLGEEEIVNKTNAREDAGSGKNDDGDAASSSEGIVDESDTGNSKKRKRDDDATDNNDDIGVL